MHTMRTRPSTTVLAFLLAASTVTALPAVGQEQGPEPGAISGRVTDENGLPLEGVCVTVDQFVPTDGTGVRTGPLGDYTIENVEPGAHLVGFNLCVDPLAGYAGEFYDDATGFTEAEPVEVQPGETTSGIDAALGPAAVISGTVTDAGEDAPIAGACVLAIDVETFNIGLTETAEDGTFDLSALAGGSYLVQFFDCADPYTHIAELYDDVTAPEFMGGAEPTPVDVAAGEERADVDAALDEGGGVAGRLTAAHNGEGLPFTCVEFVPSDQEDATGPSPWGTATGFTPEGALTDDPSEFVFGGIPAGDYQVRFSGEVCGDDGYAEEWYDDADARAGAETITVTVGQTTTGIEATLRATLSIEFACFSEVDPGFEDVSDANVHARAIRCVVALGIANGKSDRRYAPAEAVRRDQMASFIARTLEAAGVFLPEEPEDAFSDDDGNIHEHRINQLAAIGLVGGVGGGRYAPDRAVSRAQMATFLAAAYEEATGFTLRSTLDHFSDDDGSIHEQRIDHVAMAGIATGTGPSTYAPEDVVRRDQMASFLARTYDRIVRDTGAAFSFTGETATAARGDARFVAEAVRGAS